MNDLGRFFDRSGRMRRPPYRRLAGELASFLFYHPANPDNGGIPDGQNHTVLVLPAFMSADFATRPLRRYLADSNYRALPWTLGVNVGPTPHLLDGLRGRLLDLCGERGCKVSLIGISLGGLMARHMAHEYPDKVAQVITMASPYRLPTAATIEPLFNLVAPRFSKDIDFLRVSQPLPVPSMSIYTRRDGIVAWESCSDDGSLAREIDSPHTTIARHPEALRAVALRLHEGLLETR